MLARRVLTVGVFGGLICSVVASVPEARAEDTKSVCATSYESAQVLNRKADFLGARDAMRACARDSCPAFIKNDCIQWLSDVEKSIPSVVVSAQIDGRDVHEVRVEMDGKPFADTLEGHSVDVNPGRHTFTFKYQVGQDHPTQDVVVVVVVEGQKNRAVQSAYQTPPPPPDEIRRPVPASAYVLAGLGVLAIGGFVTFAELGMSKKSQLDAAGACSPFCSDSQVSPVKTDFLIGDISLAAGVVALGSAAVVLFTRPTIVIHPGGHVETATAFTPFVDVDVSSTRRGIRLGARF
jgi:hypothetical protein